MPPFIHDDKLRDRERLKALIDFLRDDVLPAAIDRAEEPLKPSLREAFAELKDQEMFDRVKNAIDKADQVKLDDHALGGRSLPAKANIIRHLWNIFQATGTIKALKRLLSGVDTLLDSVLDAVGVGKALKEIKDMTIDSLPED